MKIKWDKIVQLNKAVCEVVGQHGVVRNAPLVDENGCVACKDVEQLAQHCAREHYFVDGNKRTAMALIISVTFKDL